MLVVPDACSADIFGSVGYIDVQPALLFDRFAF
jgi:hypothetical protein